MEAGVEEHLANIPMGAVQRYDRADANRKPGWFMAHIRAYIRGGTTAERNIQDMPLKSGAHALSMWNNWLRNIFFFISNDPANLISENPCSGSAVAVTYHIIWTAWMDGRESGRGEKKTNHLNTIQ